MLENYTDIYNFMFIHKIHKNPENIKNAEKEIVADNSCMMYVVLHTPEVLNHIPQKNDMTFLKKFFQGYALDENNKNLSAIELVKPFKDDEFLCQYGMKAIADTRQKQKQSLNKAKSI